jgi:hypothetical protein
VVLERLDGACSNKVAEALHVVVSGLLRGVSALIKWESLKLAGQIAALDADIDLSISRPGEFKPEPTLGPSGAQGEGSECPDWGMVCVVKG